jgi:uncharacterized repeat protein (TIGR01451 family)
MKKILLTLISFLFFTDAHAQWEKVLGKNNVPNQATTVSRYGSNAFVCGFGGIHYSRDEGQNWKVLRPDYFKTTDLIVSTNCIANEYGIFVFLVKSASNIDSNYLAFTPNFGRTWEIKPLPLVGGTSSGSYKPCLLGQSKDYLHASINGESTNNFKPVVFKVKKDTRQIEYSSKTYVRDLYSLFVSDLAEYFIYTDYRDVYIDINYHDGRKVTKLMPYNNARTGFFIKDSLLCYYGYGIDRPEFSKNFGQTWYNSSTSLPIVPLPASSGSLETYFHFAYKNKIYFVVKAKIYSTSDDGLTWVLESNEVEKYTGAFNPVFSVQDSMLTFTSCYNPSGSCDKKYGYNILTKKITAYNTDFVTNYSPWYFNLKDKIVKLPNGKLIKVAEQTNPYVSYLSSDNGATWQRSTDYPYFFDKIQINDSTFYAFDYYNPFDSYQKHIVKFVNNIRKDTLPPASFLAFNDVIQKGDTIVATLKDSNDSLVYSTQKPYTNWTKIKVASRGRLLFFNNKKIYSYYDDFWNEVKLDLIDLNGNVQTTSAGQYGSSIRDASDPNSLWFGNIGSIYNTKDFGLTKRVIFIPLPNSISSRNESLPGSLAVIEKANVPKEKILVVITRNTPYITLDSGKTWVAFNLGIENETALKLQQVDGFLFVTTDKGLYRRSLEDINLRSVTGTVFLDINGNNTQDTNENGVFNAKIYSKLNGAFSYSDSSGRYNLMVDIIGVDTITASFDNRYATITPKSYAVSQSDTGKNFAIKLAPNINDVKGNLTAITPPRPGFNTTYLVNYKNIGSTIANGKVSLKYDARQSFIEATSVPTTNANQLMTWNYTNLQPNESRSLNVTFKTAVSAVIGSLATTVLTVDPLSIDTFKTDNIDTLIQTVVGSYDPNDKQVSFANSKTAPSVIDATTELIYTIRFQNTGNYPADFVKITDTLSDKLDVSTFRLIATSHQASVALRNKNVLVFDFNPIYLPDSMRNEAASHGFVKFAIKPKRTLTNLEDIKNTGYIYFDYNPAIVTNTIKSANAKGVGIFTPSVSAGKLAIFPNPADNIIKIEVEDTDFKEGNLSIYDVSGRLLLTKFIGDKTSLVNVNHLNAGEYICIIKSSDNKVFMSKLVKL